MLHARFVGICSICGLAALLDSSFAAGAGPELDLVIPKEVQVSTLLQFAEPKPIGVLATVAFDIDPDGLPVVADGTALKIFSSSKELINLGMLAIDDFAWMRDRALLLVTQNHLAGLGPQGVELSIALPSPGMRIRPAGDDTAYVFGGSTTPANQDVYLFSRDGSVVKLATLPGPVTAVAGDGTTTYVAIDRTIIRIALNQPTRVLLETRDPLISLEIGSQAGLFYATTSAVGFVAKDGTASEFIRGQGGLLRLRGSSLFLLVSNGPRLVRLSPIEAFEKTLNEETAKRSLK